MFLLSALPMFICNFFRAGKAGHACAVDITEAMHLPSAGPHSSLALAHTPDIHLDWSACQLVLLCSTPLIFF